MEEIKSVVVLGSGVMGAGIAAQIANAGVPVTLLDLAQTGLGKKNARAIQAIDQLIKTDPAPLTHKNNAKLITPGNFDDDLKVVKNADWVIEVIVEKLEIKQELYAKLEVLCGEETIISSNTSTIPLKSLVEGRSSKFKERFLISHFFNPPRYMRLLELVKGKDTKSEIYQRVADFCDRKLGKGIIDCHDTPGFIANRIGTYLMQTAFQDALDQDLSVEEVDAILSKPFGFPKTGVFALMDLVGLDLFPLIGQSLVASLPKDDAFSKAYKEHDLLMGMIKEGYTGRKGKGGFYRLQKSADGRDV